MTKKIFLIRHGEVEYLRNEKGQVVQYEISESLKLIKRIKLITIEDVKKSIEY